VKRIFTAIYALDLTGTFFSFFHFFFIIFRREENMSIAVATFTSYRLKLLAYLKRDRRKREKTEMG